MMKNITLKERVKRVSGQWLRSSLADRRNPLLSAFKRVRRLRSLLRVCSKSSKTNLFEQTLKGVFYIAGLLLMSLGITLTILADVGIGPWDALFVGLSNKVGLTTGSWVFIGGFVLIIINSLLLRKKQELSGLLTMFLLGSMIDFWQLVVFSGVAISVLAMSIFLFAGGMVIIGLGIAIYLQANFARNPVDSFMLAVQQRTGRSLTTSKTIIEVTALILALVVGGPVGVGTIVVALFMGPIIQLFYNPISARLQVQKAA